MYRGLVSLLYGIVGAGCRLPRPLPSWFWNEWREAAEVAVTGRWFQSRMVRGKKELITEG